MLIQCYDTTHRAHSNVSSCPSMSLYHPFLSGLGFNAVSHMTLSYHVSLFSFKLKEPLDFSLPFMTMTVLKNIG